MEGVDRLYVNKYIILLTLITKKKKTMIKNPFQPQKKSHMYGTK